MTSTMNAVMEFLDRIVLEATKMRPFLPTLLHILVSAIFPIYTAAHASLARPSSAAKVQGKKKDDDGNLPEDDEEDVQVVQRMTAWDALALPLQAGTTLVSIYVLIKWFEDPALLNKILAVYFYLLGMFFGQRFLKDIFCTVRSLVLPTQYSIGDFVWRADPAKSCFVVDGLPKANSHPSPFPGRLRNIPLPTIVSSAIWSARKVIYTKARLRFCIHKILSLRSSTELLDHISLVVMMSIVAWQIFVSTPWYLTNFMGFSFCYGSLQLISPTTGWIGTLLLSALFFYDIYFVFFTPMMVTVATKLEIPIKLLFPRPGSSVMPTRALNGSEAIQQYTEVVAEERSMAMLGLGDIVIPGMMLAFALRFDLYLFYMGRQAVTTEDPGVDTLKKSKYLSATSSWGERFWTSYKLQSDELRAKTFPKPYFHASVFGYLAGMVITIVVMQVAQTAQPALLYLVPSVLLSLWGTALSKGHLSLLWAYTEEEDEDEKDKETKEGTKSDDEKKDAKDAKVDIVKQDNASTIAAATTDKTSDGKAQTTSRALASESPISLILFSVTLPSATRPSSPAMTLPSEVSSPLPSSDSHTKDSELSSFASSVDSEQSYDVLPNVKPDHEVGDMLSEKISEWKEETPKMIEMTESDGERVGKRRRKA